MKRTIWFLIMSLFIVLVACGTPTEDNGLLFRTADPALSIGFRLLPAPPGVTVEPQVAPSCLIKGNINSKGEHIYHQPWATSYPRTIIDPDHGERWFCTADEAEAAGWRQALN